MTSRRTFRLLAFVLLAFPCTAAAQLTTQRSWGLGVALSAAGGVTNTPLELRAPIRLSPRWRLEPAFGISRTAGLQSTYSSGSPAVHRESDDNNVRFSLAVERLVPIDSGTRFYLGGRLGWTSDRFRQQVDTGGGTMDYTYRLRTGRLTAMTGVEAAVGSRMTAGAELGVTYSWNGDAKVQTPPGFVVSAFDNADDITTTGAIVVRWYLGRPKA